MKKTAALFVLILITILAAGCSGNKSPDGGTDTSDTVSDTDGVIPGETSTPGDDTGGSSAPGDNTDDVITDYRNWEKLGLPASDYRLDYIRAFVEGDIKELEYLSGVRAGLYDEYSALEVGEYSIKRYDRTHIFESNEYTTEIIDFTFEIKSGGTERFPVGTHTVEVYGNGRDAPVYIEWPNESSAEIKGLSELENWFSHGEYMMYDYTKLDNSQSEEYARYVYHAIILFLDGRSEWKGCTRSEVLEYAEKHFGFKDYRLYLLDSYGTNDSLYHHDGHGGGYMPHDYISQTETGGYVYLTVQFYADDNKTILSHLVEYRMEKLADGDYRFIDSKMIKESKNAVSVSFT